MTKKKNQAGFVVAVGFLLTFLFSNIILSVYALFNWLSDRRKND